MCMFMGLGQTEEQAQHTSPFGPTFYVTHKYTCRHNHCGCSAHTDLEVIKMVAVKATLVMLQAETSQKVMRNK